MTQVSSRLARRISKDFPSDGSADEVISLVAGASDSERVQAAIVLAAGGDVKSVRHGADLAEVDWRDVLVNGGLEHEDWRDRLDAELGR